MQNQLKTTAGKRDEQIQQGNSLLPRKATHKSIAAFIDEILRAEKRILIKLSDIHKQPAAINLHKESILIRELFSDVSKHFNLDQLSNQQYIIVKRVWNKAFDTEVIHVFTNKKALH